MLTIQQDLLMYSTALNGERQSVIPAGTALEAQTKPNNISMDVAPTILNSTPPLKPKKSADKPKPSAPPRLVFSQAKPVVTVTADNKNLPQPEINDNDMVEVDDETAVEEKVYNDLVDIFVRRKKNPPKGGRPPKGLLDKLLQPCYRRAAPQKKLHRCAADNCKNTYTNRNLKRAVRHAITCKKLTTELRQLAKTHALAQAPSTLLKKAEEEEALKDKGKGFSESPGVVVVKKRRVGEDGEKVATSTIYETAKKEGRRVKFGKLDLAAVKFYCVAGIPTYVADLDVWKELFYCSDGYKPPTRAILEEELIIGESESIQAIQLAYLQNQENLTVSCDGGTTKAHEAFWTIHISSMERKVYLMEMREATDESHTAEWIKNNVLKVRNQILYLVNSYFGLQIIDSVGRTNIAAVVSDSTGNTRLHRELLVNEVSTMLNLPDICHHISNTIKDIVKLEHFKLVVATVRGIISKIHKSHLATAEFSEAQKDVSVSRGLESIGKTRFGTLVIAAQSVERNLPTIKRLVERGKFDLGVRII